MAVIPGFYCASRFTAFLALGSSVPVLSKYHLFSEQQFDNGSNSEMRSLEDLTTGGGGGGGRFNRLRELQPAAAPALSYLPPPVFRLFSLEPLDFWAEGLGS